MHMKDFSKFNRMRCQSPKGFNHPIDGWSLSDWMTATMGELGEAANIVKKLNRERDGIVGNKDTTADELRLLLAGELADTYTYLDLTAQHAGVDLQDAAVAKFIQVSQRIGYDDLLFRRSV